MADDQSYSSPRWTGPQDQRPCAPPLKPTENGAANEVVGRYHAFTARKILEVRAVAHVAGKADTSGINIYKGTTSIGSITLGTNAADTKIDASLTDTDLAKDETLILKNIVATDTWEAFVDVMSQENFPG